MGANPLFATPGEATPPPGLDIHARTLANGAQWFYWIAALSLINSVVQLFGGQWGFFIGLGITQVLDGFANGATSEASTGVSVVVRGIAFGLDLVVAGFFVLMGWLGSKRKRWAFLVGMGAYVLDAGIFILVREWPSLAFHAFALYGMSRGYAAIAKLEEVEAQAGMRAIAPGA